MFRKMRRFNQQISTEKCIEILENEPRGVLSVNGEDGYPYAFPMNHIYMGGKLYFHTAITGHKIDALQANNKVSFCVMDKGFKKEGDWPWNINSVIIFGHITKVEDKETAINAVRKLGLKHNPFPEETEKNIRESFKNIVMLELTIDHMTGKLVVEA